MVRQQIKAAHKPKIEPAAETDLNKNKVVEGTEETEMYLRVKNNICFFFFFKKDKQV